MIYPLIAKTLRFGFATFTLLHAPICLSSDNQSTTLLCLSTQEDYRQTRPANQHNPLQTILRNNYHHQPINYAADALLHNQKSCVSWNSPTFLAALVHNFGYALPVDSSVVIPSEFLYGCTIDSYHYYFRDSDLNTVMQQWQLYNYDGFWQCIKQLPDYQNRIKTIDKLIQANPAIKKQLSKKAQDRLAVEYSIITQAQQAAEKLHWQQTVQTNFSTQKEQPLCLADYQELQEIAEQYTFGDPQRLEQRISTIHEMETVGAQYTTNTYELNQDTLCLLRKAGFSGSLYRTCYGNQLQQLIHKDCIALIKQSATLSSSSAVYCYQDALTNCIEAAREYNQTGLTTNALTLTDMCWTLLDYSKAVLEGAAHGAIGAVQDLVEHPIETALCVAAGEYVLAFQLAKVAFTIADISCTYAIDQQAGSGKWHEYTAPLKQLISAIGKKELSLRDGIKGATQLAVHWKAQSKLLGGLGKLCKTAQDKITAFIKNNPLSTPEHYLVTPEGIIVKAVHALPKAQNNQLYRQIEGHPTGAKPKKIKHPPILTEGPLWHFTQGELKEGLRHIIDDDAKIFHIFDKDQHNLRPLVEKLGGQENTVREILKALSGKVHFNEKFNDLVIHVANYAIYTRGRVMDGIPKLGTFFIK